MEETKQSYLIIQSLFNDKDEMKMKIKRRNDQDKENELLSDMANMIEKNHKDKSKENNKMDEDEDENENEDEVKADENDEKMVQQLLKLHN